MRAVKPKRPRFWLAKVLVGLCLLGFFAYSVEDYEAFEHAAVSVKGKVLSLKRESHATGRRGGRITVERPFVQLTLPDGRQIETTAKVMSSRDFTVGGMIDVEFDPKRPEETLRVKSGLPLPDVAFGVVGLVLCTFGVGERWRWRQLMQQSAPSVAAKAEAGGAAAPAPMREPLA